jgi:NAD(P)-dependent dehydrogenase (short-subunit alcohol dehydrogenase family)
MTTTEGTTTVLITGATDGLGRAAALYLAGRGCRIFAAGRSAEKRATLEREAHEKRLPLDVLEMDVCSDASVDAAVAVVESRTPRLDVLINNAGLAYVATMEEITMDDLKRQFETNFFGAVRVTQRVLPGMRRARQGRIINMSSIAGKFAWPLFGPYSASKFALEGMSDALRLELHAFGIHVVLIEPGYIPTNMGSVSNDLAATYQDAAANGPYAQVYQGFRRQWKTTTHAPRTTPEDCARVVERAMTAAPPRPRYTVTRRAALLSAAKRILPDSYLDQRTLRAYGLAK